MYSTREIGIQQIEFIYIIWDEKHCDETALSHKSCWVYDVYFHNWSFLRTLLIWFVIHLDGQNVVWLIYNCKIETNCGIILAYEFKGSEEKQE